jgi:uncharacterized integral membrane protein
MNIKWTENKSEGGVTVSAAVVDGCLIGVALQFSVLQMRSKARIDYEWNKQVQTIVLVDGEFDNIEDLKKYAIAYLPQTMKGFKKVYPKGILFYLGVGILIAILLSFVF